MDTSDLRSVIDELVGVVDTSSSDTSINAEGQRAVLQFVARVVHVVEQALQEVYVLAVAVKYVRAGDTNEIRRLQQELELVLMRSHAHAEGICGRLHALGEVFKSEVSVLLRYSPGDPRWYQLLRLLDEREGRVIQLTQHVVDELLSTLQTLGGAGFFGRNQARDDAGQTAEKGARQLHAALGELCEIRDRILGLSGHVGLLELTEDSPEQFRRQARALTVKITTGDLYRTNITGSTVGALAVGDHAVATGTVNLHQGALTQAQHLDHIKAAKKALADDEERLEAAVHEALEKFLKLAREVKVEERPMGEVQAELEGILDRVWAEQGRKALPQGLGMTQALAQSPVMAGVAKELLLGA